MVLTLLLGGCGSRASAPSDGNTKLNVVATTGQITDALANIGGDAINLTGLLGPGVDPHLYVPTESNVSTFTNADVIVYNGLHLEAQMVRVLEQMESRGVRVLSIGDSLPEEQLLGWDDQFPSDPHIWNDPDLWSIGVAAMRDLLIEADPENATLYTENAERYLEDLAEVSLYIEQKVNSIPRLQRVMITAHDAFGYFGRRFNMEVIGLQGVSTESEASASDVRDLANLIVERQIPAVFVESSVSPKTIEAVQAAVADQGYTVAIGDQLYSDALGEVGSGADTYIGMLRHNADALAKALGGE